MCYASREIIFTNSERGKSMYFENDTDLYRVIGANIKNYREQAKLTQVQLAERAKISISYLSKIEAAGCDKSLSISVLNQIANVLGVEISVFFKEVSTYDTNN
jgi:transcriptional regulator with XRE-family HTH domain